MAQFTSELHDFRTQFPFMEIDHPITLAQLNQLSEIGQSILENQIPTSILHNSFMVPVISGDKFFSHQGPEFSMSLVETLPGGNHGFISNNITTSEPVVEETSSHQFEKISESCKRKAISESSSLNSSPQVSGTDQLNRKNNSRRGKRVKRSVVEEKPQEVVHVRARRGQATDSHSLAERVRRAKINERLRCLQDIVPGCYKSMGMAVMFDEIINYVQSLQNQVEFLSMKLTEASTFYDFNSEADGIESMQRLKAEEVNHTIWTL